MQIMSLICLIDDSIEFKIWKLLKIIKQKVIYCDKEYSENLDKTSTRTDVSENYSFHQSDKLTKRKQSLKHFLHFEINESSSAGEEFNILYFFMFHERNFLSRKLRGPLQKSYIDLWKILNQYFLLKKGEKEIWKKSWLNFFVAFLNSIQSKAT